MKNKTKRQHWYDLPAAMIAEWFGVGRIPPSGTMGTLAAMPVLWSIIFFLGVQALYIFTIIIIVVGLLSIAVYQQRHQSHDAKEIVVDEVAGMSLTLCFLPHDPLSLGLGFVLFRLFDITKPYPIHLIDRSLHTPLGVMLDDLLAGVYAGLFGLGILAWLDMRVI